ncbi:MAG: rRNA maturation RNase YbeY [Armatimonadetes bacterium JP3_11]|nr:MAG: rRNA maturation RNase YbeY [Armatimonadetes bacterium JP3_11]RMH08036.1 MAG: rRNA maturation RNase YbeY [Armatimonadota bacterium]
MNLSMRSTHNLAVVLQVAPELEPILASHWGKAWQSELEHALQAAVDALVESENYSWHGDASLELCVYLSTDAEIRALNCTYRGIEKATDVLSFGYGADSSDLNPLRERAAGSEVQEAPENLPFGDIIISLETAARQAARNHHDLLTELLMLALHGTLHLMGYNDATEAERATMNARAASALKSLGYAPYEEWYSRYEET